jgi:hypothetical protein
MTWVPAWQMVVALAVAVLLLPGVGPRAVRAQTWRTFFMMTLQRQAAAE